MKKLISTLLIVFSWSVSASDLFLETGIGYDEHANTGSNPQSVIRLRVETENTSWWKPSVLEWNHNSSIMKGKPFNNESEKTSDQFSVIWRFKLL